MDDLKQIDLVETATLESNIMEGTNTMTPNQNKLMLPFILIGIVLGLGTGFFIAQQRLLKAGGSLSLTQPPQELTSSTVVKAGDIFGSADEKTFRDQAEGVLRAGGIDGEGSHHIERGDNKSQWVYVTSSVVDLDLLVGDRVAIWGETNQGKKAGWLMDVGKLKVLEVGVAPTEADTETQD